MSRTARARLSIVMGAITAALALTPAAGANPWPMDGQNAYNQRYLKSGGAWSSRVQNGFGKVWERRTGGDVRGTPITAINGVFAGSTDGTVYAWQQRDGALFWAQYVGGPVYSSPLYVKRSETDQTIYAIASKKRATTLVALDAWTGNVKWSTKVDDQFDSVAYASPAYSAEQDLVYVATCPCKAEEEGTVTNTRGTISAVDGTSGALVWKQVAASIQAGGVGIYATPLVGDVVDRLYVATGHSYGVTSANANGVFALDTATGQTLGSFQARPDDASSNANQLDLTKKQGFVSPPIALRSDLGVGSKDGNFYTFDPISLEQRWKTTVGVGTSRGGIIGASAFDGNNLYGSSSTPGLFWSLNNGGGLRWLFPSEDAQRYGPVSVANNVAWTTNSLAQLEARSLSDGRPLGRFPLSGPSTAGVSFANGYVFAAIGSQRNLGGGVAAFK